MEPDNAETNFLLESIKNELESILEDNGDNIHIDETKPKKGQTQTKPLSDGPGGHASPKIIVTPEEAPIKSVEAWTKSPGFKTLDEELQNMQIHLKESYELFQTIGDRFENINFGCLKSRIKDLHLSENNSESMKTIINDLRNSFDENYIKNRLGELTKDVSTKFKNHPGEFGDIPELTEFFRACGQLQHGLERLKKERRSVQDLTMRMDQMTQISYNRIYEMQNEFKELRDAEKVELKRKN